MEWVGIDLGADSCSVSIVDEQGATKRYLEVANKEEGWRMLTELFEQEAEIAMEASTAAYPLYDYLTERKYEVAVAHPKRLKAITASNSKTDKKDSEILANLLRLGYLPRAYIPTKEILMKRDVLMARITIGQDITRIKNRIHAFLLKNSMRDKIKQKSDIFGKYGITQLRNLKLGDHRDTILATMLAQLENLMKQRDHLQTELAKLATDDPNARLLMSIRGIDYYLGLLISSSIGPVERFHDEKAICMYSGLVPGVKNSSTMFRFGRITKEGPSHLRFALSIATEIVIRYDNPMKKFYLRVVRRTKSKKLAKTAVARKLLVMIYHMLKNKEPCRWADQTNLDRKIASLQKMCKRKVFVE